MQTTMRVAGHTSIWQRSFLPLSAAGEVF